MLNSTEYYIVIRATLVSACLSTVLNIITFENHTNLSFVMIADFYYIKTSKQKLYLIIVSYWIKAKIKIILLHTNTHKLQYNLVDIPD